MRDDLWKPEWVEAFRELWHRGQSYGDIRKMLIKRFPAAAGLSRSAIGGKAKRLRLKRSPGEARQAQSLGGHAASRSAHSQLASVEARQRKGKRFLIPSAKPKPAAPRLPEQPAPVPTAEPIGILDLTRDRCGWPLEPAGEHGWRYCGAPRDPRHKVYCPHHRMISMPASQRQREFA